MSAALLETNLPLPNKRIGKVRDLYDCPLPDGSDGLLIIATDRISAFDVVMANGLPGKGVLLTQIAKFWFDLFASDTAHHLVTVEASEVAGLNDEQRRVLAGRMMLCRRYQVIPIECIARGYLAGSGLKSYQDNGTLCGLSLPPGLVNGSRLPDPIFTPSSKAESGHDENISYGEACRRVGSQVMAQLRTKTLDLYQKARAYAEKKGIILADTKFEFGLDASGGEPVLIDEIFTPDSSRFWPARRWQPGVEQESFDKQQIRHYLQGLVDAGQWDKKPPAPVLPDAVIADSLQRYRDAFRLLTGQPPPV